MPSLGQQIKIARARKGWQQQQLAAEAHLSQKYLSQIEHDHVDPRVSIIKRLAQVLDVSTDVLLELPEVPHASHA
jgi:transcriptional regulator with XRE-family HTH domain